MAAPPLAPAVPQPMPTMRWLCPSDGSVAQALTVATPESLWIKLVRFAGVHINGNEQTISEGLIICRICKCWNAAKLKLVVQVDAGSMAEAILIAAVELSLQTNQCLRLD